MQRIKDPSAIEARFLDLAHTTDLKITPASLAYFAPCSIEDAQAVLDNLAGKNLVEMNVGDDGSIVYDLRGRQKLQLPKPVLARQVALARPSGPSSLLAVLLSLWIPGAGHLYTGRLMSAVLWFLAVGAGYVLIIPGLVLHLFCIVSSAGAASAERHRLSQPPLQLAA